MGSKSGSDLIELRMKLLGERIVVTGNKNIEKAIKGVGKATSETAAKQKYAERTQTRLTDSYKKLGTAAKWGLSALGVGGVLAIESSIHASEELGKTTIGLTRNLDLQNNVSSRWGAIAQAREIDSKSLTMSFTTLSRRMVEAGHKGGTLLTPFHQIGLSQEDAAKGAKNFEWGLMRVAKAFGEAKGGAQRQAAAQALLGRGYSTILPLFAEGTKGLKEQLGWADKYGVTLSGSTTDGLMELVQAQRENKVAMLGLELSLTKALMPAIHAGDDQLQEFIATLNSPHLTAEQKISRISHQFLMLEDDLVHVLEQALPHIAEQGGHLGIALAGALWHGFIHSDAMGKLVISAWLFNALGGTGLIKQKAKEAGLLTGRSFVIGTAAGIVFSAYLIGTALGETIPEQTREAMRQWGINAGQNFVNGLISIINSGIREINEGLNDANVLSVLGVDAPQIGEIGGVNFHDEVERQEEEVRKAPPGSINGPGGIIIGPHGEQIAPPHPGPHSHRPQHHQRPDHQGRKRPAARKRTAYPLEKLPRDEQVAAGADGHSSRQLRRGRPGGHVTIQVPLDGRVLAQTTVDLAELEASLA